MRTSWDICYTYRSQTSPHTYWFRITKRHPQKSVLFTHSLDDTQAQMSLRTTTNQPSAGFTLTTPVFQIHRTLQSLLPLCSIYQPFCLQFLSVQHTLHHQPLQPSWQYQLPCPERLVLSRKTLALEQFIYSSFPPGLIDSFILSIQFCSMPQIHKSLFCLVFLIHDPLPLRGGESHKRLSSVKEVSTRHYDYMKKIPTQSGVGEDQQNLLGGDIEER